MVSRCSVESSPLSPARLVTSVLRRISMAPRALGDNSSSASGHGISVHMIRIQQSYQFVDECSRLFTLTSWGSHHTEKLKFHFHGSMFYSSITHLWSYWSIFRALSENIILWYLGQRSEDYMKTWINYLVSSEIIIFFC